MRTATARNVVASGSRPHGGLCRLRLRSWESERFHAVGQRGGLESEKFGGAAAAINLSAGSGDGLFDVFTLESADLGVSEQGRTAGGYGDRMAVRQTWTRERQRLVERQAPPIRENDGALDHVRQLAYVARPIVLLEGSDVVLSQQRCRPVEPSTRPSEEVRGQDGNVLLPVAQRR